MKNLLHFPKVSTGFIGYNPDGIQIYMPKKKPKGKEFTPDGKQESLRVYGIRIKA